MTEMTEAQKYTTACQSVYDTASVSMVLSRLSVGLPGAWPLRIVGIDSLERFEIIVRMAN
jgi:hypothetical protein